jgi:hypothetical protein
MPAMPKPLVARSCHAGALAKMEALAKGDGASSASRLQLFVCNLDLLEDHLLGKPFDLICGQMQPRDCYPYMEPSYLIWTCWDWIAPVVGSRLGLMKTWYTLVTVDRTFLFLSSDCPVTKTRKLRLRVVARL